MGQQRAGLMVAGALACLVVGAGVERVRQALVIPEVPAEPAEELRGCPAPELRTIVVTNGAAERAAANEALRKRVAELERALAAREAAPAVAEPKPPEEARQERPSRQSFTERMEQLKKDNPEQYAEMQKRREEFRQSMEQRAQDRVEFLSAVDTQRMNDEQRDNHEKLVATVARANELRALMEQPGTERTPELRAEMGQVFTTLNELYGSERRFLFEETARAVGYEGTQISTFAEQMQTIIDNTTMGHFGHHGGFGPPPSTPVPAAPKGGQ